MRHGAVCGVVGPVAGHPRHHVSWAHLGGIWEERMEGTVRRTGPAPLNAAVTEQMRRMPRASTGPERLLRRILHRRGLRYRINYAELPGRPDLAFTRARLAVFVDGCFWHRCPAHGLVPKNNRDWWTAKLERERGARSEEKDEALRRPGMATRCTSGSTTISFDAADPQIEDGLAVLASTRRQKRPPVREIAGRCVTSWFSHPHDLIAEEWA